MKDLSEEELKALSDAKVWDAQIETDARNGKLRSLAEQALSDHESGRSSSL